MSGREFDELSRALASGGSRRDFLALLGKGITAGFLGVAGLALGQGGKCPPGTFKCGKVCCDASGDLVCHNGTCCLPPRCF